MPIAAGRATTRVAGVINRYPRESIGFLLALAATATIFVNALFLQHGPHPAPLFSTRAAVAPPPAIVTPGFVAPGQAIPNAIVPGRFAPVVAPARVAAPQTTIARSRALIVTDVQRELTRRGFYEGAADGVWGAQTDAAMRDFIEASGIKIAAEASEEALRALATSSVKAVAKSVSARPDPIAELIAPKNRVLSVQRALADFGYGQIKPNGTVGPETQTAIEKYEREHKMPVTGQISERLVRSLAAMTGRALE